jgi:HSP20 family molecular chaperone IbpA
MQNIGIIEVGGNSYDKNLIFYYDTNTKPYKDTFGYDWEKHIPNKPSWPDWSKPYKYPTPNYNEFLDAIKKIANSEFYNNLKVDIVNDVLETVVYAELPYADKDSIKVKVLNDELTISANKKLPVYEDSKSDKIVRICERKSASYNRTLPLVKDTFKYDKITVSYEDGLLTITIPKTNKAVDRQTERIFTVK